MRTRLNVEGLRRELARRGMTQAELAAVAGLAEATVSHALNGRLVEHGTIRALARALTVTPALAGADGIVGGQDGSIAGQPVPAAHRRGRNDGRRRSA